MSASDNCGSLLQAYALQHVLDDKYGCDVEILNLKTLQSDSIYEMFPKSFWRHPKKTIFTIRHFFSIKKQKQGYQLFRDEYLNLTSRIYRDAEDLSSIKNKYDVLITGSDQVWNVYMSDFNEAFFLPWKDSARKIAYAASLGSAQIINEVYASKMKNWISDFYCVSVREQSGKNTIHEIIDKDISTAADPTLLLSTGDWGKIIGEPMIKGEYIFYYSWSYPDEKMNRLVQEFSQKNNLKVYVINSSKWYKYRPEAFDFVLARESGPCVFLNLMKYAKYVFVQSFHGVVFANILQKRFFFLNENKDEKIDFRAANLINILGEEKQIVHDYKDIDYASETALTFTSESLNNLIMRSFEFLERGIKDE